MFQNDEQTERDSLIAELESAGLHALEWESGGGIVHVILPIIDTDSVPAVINTDSPVLKARATQATGGEYQAYLYIATNSLRSDCEVGVMGAYSDSDRQFASEDWREVGNLEEAVQEFTRLWKERDRWLKRYLEKNPVND